jgi:hypothetical protein
LRQLDKLFDGVNETLDDMHMWLAPLVPKTGAGLSGMNELYIVFDEPVSLSLLRVWNYAKTPARGVQVRIVYALTDAASLCAKRSCTIS